MTDDRDMEMDEGMEEMLRVLRDAEAHVRRGEVASIGIAAGLAYGGTATMYAFPAGAQMAPLYLAVARLAQRVLLLGDRHAIDPAPSEGEE